MHKLKPIECDHGTHMGNCPRCYAEHLESEISRFRSERNHLLAVIDCARDHLNSPRPAEGRIGQALVSLSMENGANLAESVALQELKRKYMRWGALAVRNLVQGDDWEDQDLRDVIDGYLRVLAEGGAA